MKKQRKIFVLLFILFSTATLFPIKSQMLYEKKVVEFIKLVSKGHSDQVTSKFQDFQKKIPRTAGLIYLEGLITSDGENAIRYFHVVVDSFPKSEWADDAMARLFEYYFNTGQQDNANHYFNQLVSEYPTSPYVTTNYIRDISTSANNTSSTGNPKENQGNEYAIQIGAFSKRENAEKLQMKFSSEGYRVDIFENLLDGRNLLYLVWIGNFSTQEEAQKLIKELKVKYNIDGVIRLRSSWKKW